MEVNIREAKTHLCRLLARVASGEEITIAKAGVPVARLVPVEPSGGRRVLGADKDSVWIANDFDAANPEIEATFEGGAGKRGRKRSTR